MAKFLDNNGLLYFWNKIKATFVSDVTFDESDNVIVKTKNRNSTNIIGLATTNKAGLMSANDKNTLENIINAYNKIKFVNFNFMLNQYISKFNDKNYKYFLNCKIYEYLFIEEMPYQKIPNILPNYLCFDDKIKKIIKKIIHEYKTKKIMTKEETRN